MHDLMLLTKTANFAVGNVYPSPLLPTSLLYQQKCVTLYMYLVVSEIREKSVTYCDHQYEYACVFLNCLLYRKIYYKFYKKMAYPQCGYEYEY